MSDSASHNRKPRRRYWIFVSVLLALIVALNALGFVPGVCDFYATYLYSPLTEPLRRLCASTQTCIGELLMFAAIAMLVIAIVLLVLRIILRKHELFVRVVRGYWKLFFAILLCTGLLFTLNWALPFRATPLIDTLGGDDCTYTIEQVETLRAQLIEGMNDAAADAPRSDDGTLVADTGGKVASVALTASSPSASDASGPDVDSKIADALSGISNEFPRLSGFYPTAKTALCSDVLEWMSIGGFTYPYTMEITYNRYVSQMYYPVLAAHESVHNKGCYLESEADFLSCLACMKSDDALLRYSGYEHAYYLVDNAYSQALIAELGTVGAREHYGRQAQPNAQVAADIEHDAQLREQAYSAQVCKLGEEMFSKLAEYVANYGWNTQKQILQEHSYSGAVELLLAYTFS